MEGEIRLKNYWKKNKFPSTSPRNLIVESRIFEGNSLSKKFFYACSVCEGPLVPKKICSICKKASNRKCTKCGTIEKYQNHENCKKIISFGKIVLEHQKKVKK